MKYITITLLVTTLSATVWNYDVILSKGYKVEVVCKHSMLIERVTFPKSTNFTEQPACYDYSNWDGSCKHPPVQCVKDVEEIKK